MVDKVSRKKIQQWFRPRLIGHHIHRMYQAMNLLRLAVFADRKDYREKAESIFTAFKPMMDNAPSAFERLMCASDFYHDKVREIASVRPRP